MAMDPFGTLDATAQAELVRRGEVHPRELAEAAISRIERLDLRVRAVTLPLFERALTAADNRLPDGPFRGVPLLLKDLSDLEGTSTSMGGGRQLRYRAASSRPYVRRLEAAGCNVVGKVSTPELGLMASTEPRAFGPTRNPWNTDRSPGGSSGGSGAAVAAGMTPIAEGSDGGGSIRMPASCCGIFGFKPSRGRLVGGGFPPDAIDNVVFGLMTRSVRDSAMGFAIMECGDAERPYPRVGLVRQHTGNRLKIGVIHHNCFGELPDPEVQAAVMAMARRCEILGHQVDDTHLPMDGERFYAGFWALWANWPATFVRGLGERLRREVTEEDVEPYTLALARHRNALSDDQFRQRIDDCRREAASAERLFDRFDVLLSPVLQRPPLWVGEQAPTLPPATLMSRCTEYVSHTPVHNVLGTPAMSVPATWTSDGLPVGVQFAAARGEDRRLLELAYQIEEAFPWGDRWPPLSAAYFAR